VSLWKTGGVPPGLDPSLRVVGLEGQEQEASAKEEEAYLGPCQLGTRREEAEPQLAGEALLGLVGHAAQGRREDGD